MYEGNIFLCQPKLYLMLKWIHVVVLVGYTYVGTQFTFLVIENPRNFSYYGIEVSD